MTITEQPGERVPVAFLGRASTLALQDPRASMRRQLRNCASKLPPGWYIAAHFWDIESGGLDLDQRGHGTGHQQVDVGIPRDGGLAALLAEAGSPSPRFAAVMCEDIERSGRDTFNALKLEKKLSAAGIPLLATDEPIDIAGMNATTILVRRVKQGIAEWFRFQLKEKAWAGFTEHTLDGYNIGPAPYGYAAHRIPHPSPVKAGQGKTKTRLMLDPGRAEIVKRIYEWRVIDRLGMNTIANRLNADPAKFPPPGKSGCWQVPALAGILANPKYTGHMVYGRTRTQGGRRGRKVPQDQWLWSPEPAHPAIITRAMWDAAQAAGREHGSSRDDTGLSGHPAARRTYPLRGIIRCRECQRRMTGHGRAGRRGGPVYIYYICTHDPSNPRHAAASPGHPPTVRVRQDLMLAIVAEFFYTRIFGPDRAALLKAALPADAEQAARRTQAKTDKLRQQIRQIDAAENAHAREIEQLAQHEANSPAITALRSRIIARFGELEEQRAAINTQLKELSATQPATGDPALLDQLPRLAGLLSGAPIALQQQLYHAFGLQLLYNREDHQVTCRATITTATPAALAAILNDSEQPVSIAEAVTPAADMTPSLHAPIAPPRVHRVGTACCRRSQRRYEAPLRSRTAPLAHSALSDARYSTAAAISPGSATRPNGLCARISSPRGGLRCSLVMSVATYPGATDITAIPCGASARASDWPKAFMPALLAPYAGECGSPR